MTRGAADSRQLMTIAIIVSLAVHAVLLSTRFVAPPSMRSLPFDSRLPVILVNSRSDTVPLNADALAQASLDGGGTADAGRRRATLPDLGRVIDGPLMDTQRQRIAELEQRQHQLLQRLTQSLSGLPSQPAGRPQPDAGTRHSPEHAVATVRRAAELASEIADYQSRPQKRQLTPTTREVPFALYYTALRKKIEQTGTLHFPRSGGTKIYGELIVSIPLQQGGTLYEAEGGPRIERSSGNPLLDAAALAIVRRAAPFGRLPAVLDGSRDSDHGRSGRDTRPEVWEVVTRFSFTREQQLQTQALARKTE